MTDVLRAKNKEYLGFCEEKGYIYCISSLVDEFTTQHHIYAIKNNQATLLITHITKEEN